MRGLLLFLALALTASACGNGAPSSPPTAVAPVELLAFSAGGSIYTVRPDGSDLRKVIPGDRSGGNYSSTWNAAPAFSPDGSRLAFTRDLDIWVADVDGNGVRLLADVGEFIPSPGASNFSTGAQSVVWSPGGTHIAYVMSRVGGSGIQDIYVVRADGSERGVVYQGGACWEQPSWMEGDRVAVYDRPGQVRVFRRTGEEERSIQLPSEQRCALIAIAAPEGRWLVGPITTEGPIMYGTPDALRQVTTGTSPVLSPDGRSVAYLHGDSLRVVAVDGRDDREIADLAPLGGRDHFFGERTCSSAACSYRLPIIAWSSE